MKKHPLVALALLLIFLTNSCAYASVLSDPVFDSVSTNLLSTKEVEFSAQTINPMSSIKVTNVKLYKLIGSSWNYVGTLAAPSYEAINKYIYGADMDYSSSIGTGTYRLLTTFCADGYSISRYSNSMTF